MAIFTWRSGATQHPEDSVLQFFTDVIEEGGVKDLSSDDHAKVVEDSPQSMNVVIKPGRLFVKGSTGNLYPVRITTNTSVLLGSNSSGNPRLDAIVVYINLSASPNTDGTGVAVATKVQGTAAASPVAPTDSEIATAIGASNPFYRLANVRVENAAVNIVNAKITDTRGRFKPKHRTFFASDSDGATITFDFSKYNVHDVTIAGAGRTLVPIGMSIGDAVILNIKQDATGGRTVSWASWGTIRWFSGTPVLKVLPNEVDSIGLVYRGAGQWDGYVLG